MKVYTRKRQANIYLTSKQISGQQVGQTIYALHQRERERDTCITRANWNYASETIIPKCMCVCVHVRLESESFVLRINLRR